MTTRTPRTARASAPPSSTPDPPDAARSTEHQPRRSGPEPLLSLSTLAPTRPTIEVDEEVFELHILDDFGIATQQQLTRDGREFNELWNRPEPLTAAEGKRLKMLLERLFDRVIELPEAVADRFSDAMKSKVVITFSMAPLLEVNRTAPDQKAREKPPTTGS